MELQNKTVIITGVSKGIGKATAQALLDKGAHVAGWGRNEPDYDHENLTFFEVDIRSHDEVAEAFQKTQESVSDEIHILINNAGVGYNAPLEELEMEKWHKMFDVNVNGLYYVTRNVLPRMKEQQKGHIVNISSLAGRNGVPEMTAYCGTKYAVRGISKALFKEVRGDGIKVTCVYPGSTNTHFFDNIEGYETADFMMKPEGIAQSIIYTLETPENFLTNSLQMRPLKTPKHM